MRNDRDLLALIAKAEGRAANPSLADGDAADAPMPIPSTWLNPPREEPASWRTRQVLGAAIGLGLGLVVIAPVLIWTMPGPAGPARPHVNHARQASPAAEMQGLIAVASSDPSWQMSGKAAADAGAAPADAGEDPAQAILLARSELLASTGDLAGARQLLRESSDPSRAAIVFALAETFDPNMLAAWGLRNALADAGQARGLYEQALAKGVERARARLEALQ